MLFPDRELLRLHVEAVWNVRLPSIIGNDMHVLPGGAMPEWSLYVAQLANERIHIWRPDVHNDIRSALLARAYKAFSLPVTDVVEPDSRREIALHLAAQPTLHVTLAHQVAQHISSSLEFEEDHFTAQQEPLIGVIVEGRLLCIAHSARRTSQACELGIDTRPEARRKGYALAATVLWTATVVKEGLIPLYSAFIENEASLRLAAAAGYREFARAVYIMDEA